MNNTKVFNMIVLGAYLKLKPIVQLENIRKGLEKSLPDRYHHLIDDNEKAVHRGQEAVQMVQEI